ncbi:MAG: dihydroxy-acid dehydratase, partial [Caulobacteraceae bacterium]|nr:dihydroxy-acid dehydratase [Caulobacteraceae bacterium]
VAPEAASGGPIALIRDGDTVTIDTALRRIDVDADLDERRAGFIPTPRHVPRGALEKYAALVSSASLGAITTGGGAARITRPPATAARRARTHHEA